MELCDPGVGGLEFFTKGSRHMSANIYVYKCFLHVLCC